MAKLLRLVIDSDFRALQAINVVASFLVFPAVFLFARQIGLRFSTSVIAGALFAFFPNVWFFGGTAFSDVPSIVLVLFAAVFLFRGASSRRDYWLGTFLLALAIGIRPQNLLIGLFPGAVATFRRPPRDIVDALLIVVVVVGVAYGGAIYATGDYDAYMQSNRHHADYISRVDSFRSPERPPLWRIFDRFFLTQYQFPPLSAVVTIFVIVSIVGAVRQRDRSMLYNFATFAPVAIMAWLMLDRYSISRFSIGYAPMFAIFAADGIARAARGREGREWAVGAALVLGFIVWTVPAFAPIRHDVAPSVAAANAARALDPNRDHLYVGHTMTRFVDYLAPQMPYTRVLDDRALPLDAAPRSFLLAEVTESKPQGLVFTRERDRLWNIARHHYFEVFLRPLDRFPRFISGWSGVERSGTDEWRWMAPHGVVELPPAPSQSLLRIVGYVPREVLGGTLTVSFNGQVLEKIVLTGEEVSRDFPVLASENRWNRLELMSDRAILRDGHPASLRLRFVSLGQR